MTNKISKDSGKRLSVLLFVLFLFTAGFFIQYGREAHASGSWKYVITHLDDYAYWSFAQASARAPEKGPNPFFYEDRDSFHLIPYPVTKVIGFLARLLNVNVLFFFPFWHIGAPFLVWLSLFYSARHFWKLTQAFKRSASIDQCAR